MNDQRIATVVLLFTIGTIGFALNGLFLVVNIAKKKFKLDYCYFVYNLAFINIVHNLNLLTFEPIVILAGLKESNVICRLTSYLMLCSALISIANQAIFAVNRYFYLFKRQSHEIFFKNKRYKLFYICLLYAVFFPMGTVFLFWDEFGFFHDICGMSLERVRIWHAVVFFIMPILFCNTVCILVAYRISRFIKNHVTNTEDRTVQSKIREGRSIVKFIILEIMLPITLESPILFTFMIHNEVPIPKMLDTALIGLFLLHTAFDPVITVVVIKPYRQDFLRYVRRIFKKDHVELITVSGRNMKNNTLNNDSTKKRSKPV